MIKNKVAVSYKSKHFIIMDEDTVDQEEGEDIDLYVDVDKVIESDTILLNHVIDCNYYGIPAYIGDDQELKYRIEKIEAEFIKTE